MQLPGRTCGWLVRDRGDPEQVQALGAWEGQQVREQAEGLRGTEAREDKNKVESKHGKGSPLRVSTRKPCGGSGEQETADPPLTSSRPGLGGSS